MSVISWCVVLKERTLSLLDVGALDLNYRSHQKFIKCTAIDLNPQKADIKQADFLTFQVRKPSYRTYRGLCKNLLIFVKINGEPSINLNHSCILQVNHLIGFV